MIDEQLSEQREKRATCVVGLRNWNSKSGRHIVDITQLDEKQHEHLFQRKKNRERRTYPITIIWDWVSTIWTSKWPVASSNEFWRFWMETINSYVRFDKSDPAKIVKDDFDEAAVPSYCHAIPLTLWNKNNDAKI